MFILCVKQDFCTQCSNLQTLGSKYCADFSSSEDIDFLHVMDNVQELYNHDWDWKIGFWDRNGGISGTDKVKFSHYPKGSLLTKLVLTLHTDTGMYSWKLRVGVHICVSCLGFKGVRDILLMIWTCSLWMLVQPINLPAFQSCHLLCNLPNFCTNFQSVCLI